MHVASGSASEAASSSGRILVVDDDADQRAALVASLQEFGYEVDAAADGAEALARVRQRMPDLILLDLIMPAVDGWDAMRRLGEEWGGRRPPVVAVTARGGLELKALLRAAGFTGYLGKPFTVNRLIRVVRKALTADSEGEWIELPPGPLDPFAQG